MHNSQNKKRLQMVLIVLIAVLTIGIGYASISAINLIISGNATASANNDNFKVHFVQTGDTPSLTGNVTLTGSATIDGQDNTKAHFSVSGLTKVGDYAIATYTVINNSDGLGTTISLEVENSNSEYFKVTETITDNKLQAGETTTGTIKVEMIKTPIDTDVSTSVVAKLIATPIEDAEATGGDSDSETGEGKYYYTTLVNDTDFSSNITSNEKVYETPNQAILDLSGGNAVVYKRLFVVNNNVVKKYIVQQLGGDDIYIQYGVDESSSQYHPVFDENKRILKENGYQGNCSESETLITCSRQGFYAEVKINGQALLQENNYGCDENTCGSNFPSQF